MKVKTTDQLIELSQQDDQNKARIFTSKKKVSLSVRVTDDGPYYTISDTSRDPTETFYLDSFTFTEYSWKQFWNNFLKYPVSGVLPDRISPDLVIDIARDRQERVRNSPVLLQLRKMPLGTLYRGHTTPRGEDHSVTKLLQAVNLGQRTNPMVCVGDPSFQDEIFYAYLLFPNQDQDEPQVGCAIETSEVGAVATSFRGMVYLHEHGVSLSAGSFSQKMLTLGAKQRETNRLIEDTKAAIDSIKNQSENIQDCLKKANDAKIANVETAITRTAGTYALSKADVSTLSSMFDVAIQDGKLGKTRFGLAVSLAKVAETHNVGSPNRKKLELAAGSILQTRT